MALELRKQRREREECLKAKTAALSKAKDIAAKKAAVQTIERSDYCWTSVDSGAACYEKGSSRAFESSSDSSPSTAGFCGASLPT